MGNENVIENPNQEETKIDPIKLMARKCCGYCKTNVARYYDEINCYRRCIMRKKEL